MFRGKEKQSLDGTDVEQAGKFMFLFTKTFHFLLLRFSSLKADLRASVAERVLVNVFVCFTFFAVVAQRDAVQRRELHKANKKFTLACSAALACKSDLIQMSYINTVSEQNNIVANYSPSSPLL